MLIPTNILFFFVCKNEFWEQSDFIKWSFWKRTAKRFIPMKSACLTVEIPYIGRSLRLLNRRFMAENCVCATIDTGSPMCVLRTTRRKHVLRNKYMLFIIARGSPHFWSSANIILRPPSCESKITQLSSCFICAHNKISTISKHMVYDGKNHGRDIMDLAGSDFNPRAN